jgi:hypothetical protein
MMSINLNCGRKVIIWNFSLRRTYSGFLEGRPNEKINKKLFDSLTYPSEWGDRKHIKILPPEIELKNKLKPIICAAFLESEPIDPICDGSQLVVIWLADEPNRVSLEEYIESGIKDIDWNNNAQDFDY